MHESGLWACRDPVRAQRLFGLDSADAGLEKIKNFGFLLKPNFISMGVITLLNFIKICQVCNFSVSFIHLAYFVQN